MLKSFTVHGHYKKSCSNTKHSNEDKVLPIYKSIFNQTTYNKNLKKCLRICPLSESKIQLLNTVNDSINNYESKSFDYEQSYSCFNSLDMFSVLEDFGLGQIRNQTTQNYIRLKIIFSGFIKKLSNECSAFEMMYKFTVKFRKIYVLSSLNQLSNKDYSSQSSLETEQVLKLESNSNYELVVFLQTPFDKKPLMVGSYFLEKNLKTSFVEPDFKKLKNKPAPYIFMYSYLINGWHDFITTDSITVFVLLSSSYENSTQIDFILTEKGIYNISLFDRLFGIFH